MKRRLSYIKGSVGLVEKEELSTETKTNDMDSVLNQVNLKRLKGAEGHVINQDRIKKLSEIRDSIAMLEQE